METLTSLCNILHYTTNESNKTRKPQLDRLLSHDCHNKRAAAAAGCNLYIIIFQAGKHGKILVFLLIIQAFCNCTPENLRKYVLYARVSHFKYYAIVSVQTK